MVKATRQPVAQPTDARKENVAAKEAPKETLKELTPPALILESDKHWKSLHVCMVKNEVNLKSKVSRDGGLQINAKSAQVYRKVQDHLQRFDIRYPTYAMEKSDLRVVERGLPMPSDIEDIQDDLCAQGINLNSDHTMQPVREPRKELPLLLIKVKRGDDKIYKVTIYLNLLVQVEKERERSMPQAGSLHHAGEMRQVRKKAPRSRMRK